MELFFITICILLLIMLVMFIGFVKWKQKEKLIYDQIRSKIGDKSEFKFTEKEKKEILNYYNCHKRIGQLDDITWKDFSLDELFSQMNYSHTACGRDYLYYVLRSPALCSNQYILSYEQMKTLQDDSELLSKVRYLFWNFTNYKGNISYEIFSRIHNRKNPPMKRLLIWDIVLVLAFCCMYIHTGIGILWLLIVIFHNMLLYFQLKKEHDYYVQDIISAYMLTKLGGQIPSLLQNDVWKEEMLQLKFIGQKLAGLTNQVKLDFVKGTFAGPFSVLLDYIKMITFYDFFIIHSVQNNYITHIEELKSVYDLLGRIEASASVAMYLHYRKDCVFCKTRIHSDCYIACKEMIHPLLTKPVANDFTTYKGVLITGANASGKSTFLRGIGVNQVLAQTIGISFAKEFYTGLFLIQSSMGIQDNLLKGDSYYLAEIKNIKSMIENQQYCQDHNLFFLCFLDEVLRGTNTIDRIAAGTEILQVLQKKGTLCFAATHDLELTKTLGEKYDDYYFQENMSNQDVNFSYKISAGVANSRNAIYLLQYIGIDNALVDRAQERANTFIEKGTWE